jgi:hypothetical protein
MTNSFENNWFKADKYCKEAFYKQFNNFNEKIALKEDLINHHLLAVKFYNDLGKLEEEELVNNSYDNFKIILAFICNQKKEYHIEKLKAYEKL